MLSRQIRAELHEKYLVPWCLLVPDGRTALFSSPGYITTLKCNWLSLFLMAKRSFDSMDLLSKSHFVKSSFKTVFFFQQVKDATRGVQWAAVPGAECLLLSNAGIFLRTAKSLTNSYGVAIIEDVHPGYYQVNEKIMFIFIHNCLYMLKAQKSNVRQRVASLSVLHRMFGTVVSPLYQFSKSWPISDQNTSFLNPTFRRGPKNLSPYFQSWWFVYQRK